jgi:small ligand-binding sensory domain FIST
VQGHFDTVVAQGLRPGTAPLVVVEPGRVIVRIVSGG